MAPLTVDTDSLALPWFNSGTGGVNYWPVNS
jgi:hypothetical protein